MYYADSLNKNAVYGGRRLLMSVHGLCSHQHVRDMPSLAVYAAPQVRDRTERALTKESRWSRCRAVKVRHSGLFYR